MTIVTLIKEKRLSSCAVINGVLFSIENEVADIAMDYS